MASNTYKILKRDPDGKSYDVIIHSNEKLTRFINATFKYTDHEIIAIINLTPFLTTKSQNNHE